VISLKTQKDSRDVRNLPFCYICGNPFEAGDSINYDHVPPESIFDKPDRNFPLKPPTHLAQCHSPMNLDDEVLGQLVALIHGKQPSKKNDKLKIQLHQRIDTGELMASFSQRNIELLLRRWLKGFHAALYREPLDTNTKFAIQTPFPSGSIINGEFIEEPIPDQHYKFVEAIKRNRLAKNVDHIETNNQKLRYECVWDKFSDNSWGCIFALDLYEWKNLGDINNFHARGCAGLYRLSNGSKPSNGSPAMLLKFSLDNLDTADPFSL
jgi:hypothetical protein